MSNLIAPTEYQNRVLSVPEHVNVALLGGRGGGKSTSVLFLVLRHCVAFGDRARPLVVRASYKALLELEEQASLLFATAFPGGVAHNRAEHVIRLPNGAVVEFGQLENSASYNKYQGRSFTLLAVDEITNFKTERHVNLLRSNVRGPAGMPLRVVLSGNPGGALHVQIAKRHVNGRIAWRPYDVDGDTWVTCPSVYTDNPHIDHARYARQIQAAAGNDRVLADAWLSNRWDEIRGAFFADVWSEKLLLPRDDEWRVDRRFWHSFVALDWGMSAPSVVLFMAQARTKGLRAPGGRVVPVRSYVVVDELATAHANDPNEGLGWPPQMLAEETLARCKRWGVAPHGVGDDARGLQNDTLLEQLGSYGLHLDKPTKDRISGWVRLKQLMASARDDDPDRAGVFISERCRYLCETIPVLPRSELRPEDVDTDAADHGADALRYAVVAEPRIIKSGRVMGWGG